MFPQIGRRIDIFYLVPHSLNMECCQLSLFCVYTVSDGGNVLFLMYTHLLTCTPCCLVAGDSVPDVGSSSLLYY